MSKENIRDVSDIVDSIDFSKPNATIYLRFLGDDSRYHDMITLSCTAGEWSLYESHLTPEFSFHRSTSLPGFSVTNAKDWLERLFQLNPVIMNLNASCPRNGLILPDWIGRAQD